MIHFLSNTLDLNYAMKAQQPKNLEEFINIVQLIYKLFYMKIGNSIYLMHV